MICDLYRMTSFSQLINSKFVLGWPDFVTWFRDMGGVMAFWNTGSGAPYNFPLWFIRDLMVLFLLTPVIYWFIKRSALLYGGGLIILYLSGIWKEVPGFSPVGIVLFTLGASFSIKQWSFCYFSRKNLVWLTSISVVICCVMVMTFGDYHSIWGVLHRIFSLVGSFSFIGMVTLLFEKEFLQVRPFLSKGSFFIYAAHMAILHNIQLKLQSIYFPSSDYMKILYYFAAPFFTVLFLYVCYFILGRIMPKALMFITGERV